ncbi:factor of DNA methylation 1-like [Vigna radiata var. radiata]|uniref:Factor of DNA methylation 1-like n=1 Tax=Vigna radiata var. radiata TaxID=3916 RepID=A0A1S3V076_VIGRR|nr:factor of DNA methylation 1-like [Vigna radiata var. radiata]
MANHKRDESTSKKNIDFYENMKELFELQKQKITDLEDTHVLKTGGTKQVYDTLRVALNTVKREISMDKDSLKELKQIKVMNSNMSGELERLKKENEMITKELAESKALTDKLKLAEENMWMRMKLIEENGRVIRKYTEENGRIMRELEESEVLNDIRQKNFSEEIRKDDYEKLKAKVVVLEEELETSKDFNQALITKEREINDELEKARKKLMEEITEISCLYDNICVRRVGEIDTEPFIRTFRARKNISKEDADQTALKMCSLWQKNVEDPHWYPFKIITNNGKPKEVLDEDDGDLIRLKEGLGYRAYKAVVAALIEMNEYNSSGRFIVREIWNKEKGRRATLKEGIEFMINQIKSKRRKTEMVNDEATEEATEDRDDEIPKGSQVQ